MENNGHSANVRLWLEPITSLHIDLHQQLLAKHVLSKGGCYIKTINHISEKNYPNTLAIGTQYTKRCKVLFATSTGIAVI